MKESDLIGLYVNFVEGVGTITINNDEGKSTTTLTPELLQKLSRLIIQNIKSESK